MRQAAIVCFLVGLVCALLTLACDRPKREANRDRSAEPVPEEVGDKPLVRADDAPHPVGGALRPAPSGPAPVAEPTSGFEPPEVILDGSEYGRLYPTFADIDGDGKTDLLVGNWRGRLLLFRNQGTNARPVYAKPTWLDETVPTANISGVQG
jgi:hypothetical protein